MLASRFNVIVVTLNYRLGPLGFLATEEDGKISANYGMQDQREAIKWVKNEIPAFGGDPAEITLFGQSAGAISILHHMISPKSKGLFKRAISESGFPSCNSPTFGVEIGLNFSTKVGCNGIGGDKLKACLKGKSVQDIITAADIGTDVFTTAGWGITVDGTDELPTTCTSMWMKGGGENAAELLIGTNTDEGNLFVFPSNPLGIWGVPAYENFVDLLINSHDPALKFNSSMMQKVYALYPGGAGDNRKMAGAVLTDFAFLCGSHFAAANKAAAGGSNKVYMYRFNLRPECMNALDPETPGMFHTLEIPFVFETPLAAGDCIFTEAESKVMISMSQLWVDFATKGKPSTSWPEYTASKEENVVFQRMDNLNTESMYNKGKCAFWEQFYSRL
jgi:para-nitrobenzyl esterase